MAEVGKFSRCPLCYKQFSTSGSLSKHKKRVHKVPPDPARSSTPGREVRCGERGCSFVATRRDDMRDHLVVEHDFALVEVQEQFDSMAEFRQWMDLVSNANRTQFAARACDVQGKASVHRYVCHRSGASNLKVTARQRRVKVQGSCKMGGWCTAYLNARECLVTGAVKVNGCLTHYGHDLDVAHLRISTADRSAIVEEIRRGVPFDRILETIRSDFPANSKDITRTHLITMGDIRNIAVSEGLLTWKLDVDDEESVRKLAERFACQAYSPILLYKPMGSVAQPEARSLRQDDMVLVIQTQYQRDTLLDETGRATLLCVEPVVAPDSKFTLIALLAANGPEEVSPVAWCICNVVTSAVVQAFYRAVCQNMPELKPQYLMSDDSDYYYSAWLDASGADHKPHKLLSPWHITKAWAEALNSCVKNRDKRASISKALDNIKCQELVDTFQDSVAALMGELKQDEETSSFAEFFESAYAERPEQWAHCYVRDVNIDSDMFQKLLKRLATRMKAKRLDKLAHTLLLTSESKQCEHFAKCVRGRNAREMALVIQAHQVALSIPPEDITRLGDDRWSVEDNGGVYEVSEVFACRDTSCPQRCNECDVCIHLYACTCPCTYMCKHIHACVVRGLQQNVECSISYEPTEVIEDPCCKVEQVEEVQEVPEPAGSQTFFFSNLPPPQLALQGHPKKLEMIQALHGLNETCVKAAEFLSERELPLPNQADYLISALKTTNAVLDSFYRKCMTRGLGKLIDHDYSGLPGLLEESPMSQGEENP
ncbi:uncharacterized protein LOC8030770 [Ixodes scapularis]|uniref:uncharacterized protein LOC8030770 n=1 Tax=Ixodes scapularis TaxID=6945 RepID=UPI001A9EEB3E|nr:uncharacterized protein LOC8030770 [Ixodes scapularis]